MWQQCYSTARKRRHWKQKYRLEDQAELIEKNGGLNFGNGYGNRYGRYCLIVVLRPFLEVYFKSMSDCELLWRIYISFITTLFLNIIQNLTLLVINVADFLFSIPTPLPPQYMHFFLGPLFLGPSLLDCKPLYFNHLSIPPASECLAHSRGLLYICKIKPTTVPSWPTVLFWENCTENSENS